jgi:pimeloyl-ACP methyl ester carboxylesterase
MGAALAALFAAARPRQIQSLVLVEASAPAHNGDAGELLGAQLDYLAAPPRPRVFASMEQAAERLREGFPSLDRELARAMAGRLAEPLPEGVCWRWDPRLAVRASIGLGSFTAADPAALLRSLEKLGRLVTLVRGADSHLLRPEDALAQQKNLSTARQVVLPGGHNLHYDSPAALAEVIAETAAGLRLQHVRAATAEQDRG